MHLVTEPIVLSKCFYNPNPGNPEEYEYRDSLVFFDLETTGLDRFKDQIIQIAAKSGAPGGKPFTIYIKPTSPIPADVTRVSSLTYKHNTMRYKGIPVKSSHLQKALREFLLYLESFETNKKLIIIAHNVQFDATFLVRSLAKFGMLPRFEARVD